MTARKTKLYRRTGSPLIQGQSKQDRPSWQPFIAGWLLGWALLSSVASVVTGAALADVPWLWIAISGATSAIGSFVGAEIGKGWGDRRRWVFALTGALLVGGAGLWLLGVLAEGRA